MGGTGRRWGREEAEPVVAAFCAVLDDLDVRYHLGGSWRRRAATVGDLDVVLVDDPCNGLDVLDSYTKRGARQASGMFDGLQIDMWSVMKPEEIGAFMHFVTGPVKLNLAMRMHARRRGMTLSQYGLFERDGRQLDDGTERGVSERLGWPWLEPEEREGWHR